MDCTQQQKININYKTNSSDNILYNNLYVQFGVSFGEGTDSKIEPSSSVRTHFTEPYMIETFTKDEANMYRIVANEGVFIIRIDDINIKFRGEHPNYNYEYGVRIVVDLNKKPVYLYSGGSSYPTNTIERDGGCWDLPNGRSFNLDQNSNAKFQWSTAKALSKGQKCTQQQMNMGIEERHENTGMVYITCIPINKKTRKQPEAYIYRGGSSDGVQMRGGVTRGGSHAARVGYGSAAATNSASSDFLPFSNGRYVLPIRFRIDKQNYKENDGTSVRCAKNFKFAQSVEQLQQNTDVMGDESSDEE